ncbi:DNA repair protein RecN [Phaeovulum vinaykumarii]|uniref:DNA repair protein RecN n=1 Tax=Phaeovulum vinaykumarii TaxID=407234 RepID=A0A1N7MGK7_9RHOB|nr:DNA repair protein RecN [Phaeovulum vinaykumarii]SIS85079.1 DNA replication and repair protein RecN [Phaeovulum vinaykumarii]SOC12075.1 DNA replication and repair protein RecN [Phaeovulum vinaykumarii]
MLVSLEIRDMVLIEHLTLGFRPGLNVLTGETGAGKSILLDCLGFVLGWRTRAGLVREGAATGEVTAVFDLPAGHGARAILREAGLPEGAELILRRQMTADGRRTAWVNDRRAGAEVLRALSGTLVELHGQHDDRGLMDARGHRALLDAFAEAGADLAAVRAAWETVAAARAAEDAARARLAAARAEEDFLRHAVAELEKLAPEAGEEADLDTRRRQMQAGARISADLARAVQALGPEGAEGLMRDAGRWLDGAVDTAGALLEAPMAALERAVIELAEAHQGVEEALEQLAFDPHELERIEERLFAIRALARKHAVLPDDLAALAADLSERLHALDAGAGELERLSAETAAAVAAHDALCAQLSARRAEAAARLDAAMAQELAPLKMERAVFQTVIETATPGPEGADQVSFRVATNPGAPAGALNRIASGGELSRFLLALKVCLARSTEALVMIFDEIDRGVGGATADAVGRRLARLAEGAQVLVVTHSPQVAARGAHHWRVEKAVTDGVTRSRVVGLDAPARETEIARMLAGESVTDAARAAARALIAG